MSQRYIGGLETLNPTPLNPALGNAANGIFSMSQYFSLKNQGLWPAIDPYFDYTTLLLHGNGTNGAQNNTFLDSSTNNFTITRNGNTTQGTFTPYGSNWSNFFSSSQLSVANSTNLDLGSGNWTIEAWLYPTSFADYARFFSKQASSGLGFLARLQITTGYVFLEIDQTGIVTSSTAPALNTWSHVAIVRSSNTVTIYINGTSAGSASYSGTPSSQTAKTTVSGFDSGPAQGEYFPGYISNLRFVKGSAVYTSNFTPSTAPLTAITNTQLLTCQNNRFIDNSSNAFTVTVNVGSPSVQRFSPFNPSAPYAAGTIGGSGYFDGSGDYLSVADNAAFDFGSGDFTIECWAYTDTFASQYNVLVCQWNTSYSFIFRITSSLVGLYINVGNPYTLQDYSASVTNTTGQWNHFCVTRSGSTLTFYKNGASIGTSSISATITNAASDLTVGVLGDLNATTYHKGYISGMRLIKGTAVAPTITTPPTAVSGTSLLLNMTNGGIIDNAMMNDLETVGNAQISTTQSKFGGSSLYFDGTGDWLSSPASPIWIMSGDWTIEGWIYPNSVTGVKVLIDTRNRISGGSSPVLYTNGTNLVIDTGAGAVVSAGTVSLGSSAGWQHVAATRSGNSWRLFINGTQVGSTTTNTTSFTTAYGCTVGSSYANEYYNGYMQDLRITKGIARYTSNFTPQTSQWQDQ